MEYTEQHAQDGSVHQWGTRWDLGGIIGTGTSVIVTHTYARATSPSQSPQITDMRYRLVIGFRQRPGSENPWDLEVVYDVQEALHPDMLNDPCWIRVGRYSNHDVALAAMETIARVAGWVG